MSAKVQLDVETAEAIVEYLANRPYKEVFRGVAALSQAIVEAKNLGGEDPPKAEVKADAVQ